MKLLRKVGSTSQIFQIFIQDSSSTTGAGLTGLAFNTASLTAYYHKDTDTTATAITLVTMTVGTFTSSGFKEIDATNMPGWYQFCPPNAALSSGTSVGFHLKGAASMAPLPIEVDLDAQVDVTHLLGTAWLAPGTAGTPDVNVKLWNALTTVALPLVPTVAGRTLDVSATGEGGVDWANVGSPTTTVGLSGTTVKTATDVEAKLPAALVGGRIDASVGAMAANVLTATAIAADAITDAKVASDVTIASVTGAVGSVTGAVGSVTGAVGSVTGAVGSVTGAVGSVTGAVGSVAAGGIAAASFVAGAINAAAIATDAIDADALATDAVAEIWAKACTEPTAAVAASPTAIAALSWLLTFSRNKITQTATTQILKADDGTTTVATSTVSDDAVTFTRGEFA